MAVESAVVVETGSGLFEQGGRHDFRHRGDGDFQFVNADFWPVEGRLVGPTQLPVQDVFAYLGRPGNPQLATKGLQRLACHVPPQDFSDGLTLVSHVPSPLLIVAPPHRRAGAPGLAFPCSGDLAAGHSVHDPQAFVLTHASMNEIGQRLAIVAGVELALGIDHIDAKIPLQDSGRTNDVETVAAEPRDVEHNHDIKLAVGRVLHHPSEVFTACDLASGLRIRLRSGEDASNPRACRTAQFHLSDVGWTCCPAGSRHWSGSSLRLVAAFRLSLR